MLLTYILVKNLNTCTGVQGEGLFYLDQYQPLKKDAPMSKIEILKNKMWRDDTCGMDLPNKIAQLNQQSLFVDKKFKKSAAQAVCTKRSAPWWIFHPSPPEETHLSPSHGMKVSLE